jgi:hypothetical protein
MKTLDAKSAATVAGNDVVADGVGGSKMLAANSDSLASDAGSSAGVRSFGALGTAAAAAPTEEIVISLGPAGMDFRLADASDNNVTSAAADSIANNVGAIGPGLHNVTIGADSDGGAAAARTRAPGTRARAFVGRAFATGADTHITDVDSDLTNSASSLNDSALSGAYATDSHHRQK